MPSLKTTLTIETRAIYKLNKLITLYTYINIDKNTVKLGYNEHGYNEHSVITNKIFWLVGSG